jgi:hypothetical protein
MVCLRRVVLGGSVFLFQGYCMLSNKLLVKNISYSGDASLQCSIIYSINRLRAFTQVIHYFISTSLYPIHYFIQSITSSNPLLHPIYHFIQSITSSHPSLQLSTMLVTNQLSPIPSDPTLSRSNRFNRWIPTIRSQH